MSPSSMALLIVVLIGLLVSQNSLVRGEMGLECNSCGKDCSAVCGSRQFRSCCFNYIKKKRSVGSVLPKSMDSSETAKKPQSYVPMMILENETGNQADDDMVGSYISPSLYNNYASHPMIDGFQPLVYQRSQSNENQKLSPKYWAVPHLGFQGHSYRYLSSQDRDLEHHQ